MIWKQVERGREECHHEKEALTSCEFWLYYCWESTLVFGKGICVCLDVSMVSGVKERSQQLAPSQSEKRKNQGSKTHNCCGDLQQHFTWVPRIIKDLTWGLESPDSASPTTPLCPRLYQKHNSERQLWVDNSNNTPGYFSLITETWEMTQLKKRDLSHG